jgi:hypothetical protein
MCNGFSPSDAKGLSLMRATGAPRTYFLKDKDAKGCPSDAKACHASYILPGQEVIADKRAGGFICAFFPNTSGGSAGWVRADALTPSPVQPNLHPVPANWVGHWANGDNAIDIKLSGKALNGSGQAFWNGGNDNVHDGAFDGTAKPSGTDVSFKDGDCSVSATLFGDYLFVTDNDNCGGMNVSFNGVYRRKH